MGYLMLKCDSFVNVDHKYINLYFQCFIAIIFLSHFCLIICLFTVINFTYSYLIPIIFKWVYSTHKWNSNRYYTTLSESGSGSKEYSTCPRTGALSLDVD